MFGAKQYWTRIEIKFVKIRVSNPFEITFSPLLQISKNFKQQYVFVTDNGFKEFLGNADNNAGVVFNNSRSKIC